MISYTPPYALHPRTALTPLNPPNQVPQHETNWALHTPYNPYIPLHPLTRCRSMRPTGPCTPLTTLTSPYQVPQHETNWVACDSCGKWRKLPPGVRLEEEQASSRWLCKHNVWDRKRNSCKAAEEPWA